MNRSTALLLGVTVSTHIFIFLLFPRRQNTVNVPMLKNSFIGARIASNLPPIVVLYPFPA